MIKNKWGFDLYKERGESSALFAEPTNVLSNVAFFAAALMVFPFCKGWASGVLTAGCILVGLGSSLYHSRPNRFTQLWDVTAIVAWVLFYLYCWGYYMMGFTPLISVGAVLGFILLSLLFLRKYGSLLNGSADYIPVIVLLLGCGVAVWYKLGHPHLVIAGIIAAISLVFRVIDNEVKLHSGTHFMWHIMNGFLMAQLTMFVAVYVET